MSEIMAIANQKGGVGKTTTTINLSAALAEQGKRVLIIDMDPQGNTSSGLGIDKDELETTVYQLMIGDNSFDECVQKDVFENLDVLAANVNLAGIEIETMDMEDRNYIPVSYTHLDVYKRQEPHRKVVITLNREFASELPRRNNYRIRNSNYSRDRKRPYQEKKD